MGNLSLTIGGTERKGNVDRDTFRITERNGIATAQFSIVDKARSITVADDAEVIIQEDTTRIFAGHVREVNPKAIGRTRIYEVTCQDYNVLLDEDVVTAPANRQVVESDRARIQWLMTTHGTKGITSTTYTQVVLASMPLGEDGLPRQDFGGKTMREALDQVATISGARYHVDFNKELHWYPPAGESLSAPFHLSDTPNNTTTFPHFDLQAPRNAVEYRNAVFVRGTGIYGWRPNPPPGTSTRRAGVLRDDQIVTQAQLDAAGDAYLAQHALHDNATCYIVRAGIRTSMAIQVTSAIHGFSAKVFQVREIETTLVTKQTQPVYRLSLGINSSDLASIIGGGIQPGLGAVDSLITDPGATGQPVADLTIGGQNLLSNSSFENAATSGYAVGSQWAFGSTQTTPYGTKVARIALSSQTGGNLDSPKVAVAITDDYWMSAWNFVRSRSAGTIIIEALEYASNGTTLLATTVVRSVTAADTDWNRVSIRFGPNTAYGRTQFNASTAFLMFRFRISGTATATWDVDAIQIERSSLLTAWGPTPYELVDGSVGTTQIADDSVTTQKVVANAITSGKIAADAVTATQIQANAVTANKIASGAIQTTHFAATAAAPEVDNSDSSVIIDPNGIIVNNGKITLVDIFGRTVMTGAGFSDTWLDFLDFGGYNAIFRAGSTATIAAATALAAWKGSGANSQSGYDAAISDDIAYWGVTGGVLASSTATFTVGTNRTLGRVTDSGALGGAVVRWERKNGDTGSFAAAIFQDFPIRPGWRYSVTVTARQSVTNTGNVWAECSFRDKNHVYISDANVTGILPLPTTAGAWTHGTTDPSDAAPANARFMRIVVDASGNAINVDRQVDVAAVRLFQVDFPFLRMPNGTDATATSDNHPLTIGNEGGDNLALDNNEVQARSNGAVSSLGLNKDGGDVVLFESGPSQPIRFDANGWITLSEQGPAVGLAGANTCRIYATDNGAGKTSLRVRFPSGGAVTIATEP